jgi:hypothetical protein
MDCRLILLSSFQGLQLLHFVTCSFFRIHLIVMVPSPHALCSVYYFSPDIDQHSLLNFPISVHLQPYGHMRTFNS